MKIGWFLTCYGPLGGVRSVIETGNSLIKKGHDFFVLGHVGNNKSTFCEDLIPVINHINFSIFEKKETVCKILSNMQFDIIFNQDPATMIYSECVNAKKKIIHYCGGLGDCYEQYENIDAIRTACSKLLLEMATKHDISGKYKKYFIGQGINFDEFKPMDFTKSRCYKIRDNNKINILCCGSRGGLRKSNKGTYDIIEASNLLDKNKYNFIYFDLDKQDFPLNFKCIETKNHRGGGIPLSEVYSICDIFVAPDYVSAWNCCAAEAMACKKPVIVSRPGIEDFGKDMENCLVFRENEIDSPKILAEKIEFLSNNEELMRKIKNSGYENIQNFTWDKVAEKIINIAYDQKL